MSRWRDGEGLERQQHTQRPPDDAEHATGAGPAPGKYASSDLLGSGQIGPIPNEPGRRAGTDFLPYGSGGAAGARSDLPPIGSFERLVDTPAVQRRATGDAGAGDPAAVAQSGVAGASGPLPHLDQIRRSFGRHDVSHVRAAVGGDAATASGALGASAYATGDRVGFAGTPDLHTAAHEAAHVVQQRAGVHLRGGIDGGAGDPYEQHADAVADKVVRGESAEALLDQHAGGGGASHAVQRDSKAPAPATAATDGTPATVKAPHAKWPVLADTGKPYKIVSAKDPVQFWTVSAWIRAGAGFKANGLHATSPACAAEIIQALGWVPAAHVATAAAHVVFDLHRDVTVQRADASAF